MIKRFQAKGWSIQYTTKDQDRITIIPPDRLQAKHLFGIYVPVQPHTWQPDMAREWYAALYDSSDKRVHGPTFEAKAHPDDEQRFVAFATWIGDLIKNPEKFIS